MMREEYVDFDFDHVLITPSVFLFAVGTLASVFAMIGFVAALRDNISLLKTVRFFSICIHLLKILVFLNSVMLKLIFWRILCGNEIIKNYCNIEEEFFFFSLHHVYLCAFYLKLLLRSVLWFSKNQLVLPITHLYKVSSVMQWKEMNSRRT